MFKKCSSLMMILCFTALSAVGCSRAGSDKSAQETTAPAATASAAVITGLSKPDMTKWRYDADNDFYYQIGISYCEKPADESYEKLEMFVPGKYMDATENSDHTYTCKLREDAEINGYTASTAPIVMPVNTPGYLPDRAWDETLISEYFEGLAEEITQYTNQGFVFVHAGCRGIDEGVPAGVTDLKAAVRYIRYCDDVTAGDAESIFAFGMSGGGAQAAILGAAGDSALYNPYLEAIGAVQGVSDAIAGSMDWCPITELDTANAEYEWMMGCTRPERSAEEQAVSDHLAVAFAEYINKAGFTDKDGNALTLTESADGIYQAGTYYDYIKSVIEQSLSHYLTDNAYTPEKAQAYIDDLNKDKKWITYEKATNTVSITSIADFAKTCKQASDMYVAFDQPQSQNNLFGYGDGEPAHFDSLLAGVLTELNSPYAADYNDDLAKTDFLNYTVEQRMNMYTPLYYLMQSREGYGSSTVAKYWRIRSGIEQVTTSLTTEVNLALALEHCDGVKSVDFETVWAQEHTEAERIGNSTENFIEWVKTCTNR